MDPHAGPLVLEIFDLTRKHRKVRIEKFREVLS